MRKIFYGFLLIFISSCTLKEQDKLENNSYFNLPSYFKSEANRLTKANLQIVKTVTVNDQKEQKKVKIGNWEKEFDSFISADINKASWNGEFKVKKNISLETYSTNNEKIAVKKVEISYRNEKIFAIKIYLSTANKLYTSKDSLCYYPDSLYEISKVQKIKLMDQKSYQIIGKF